MNREDLQRWLDDYVEAWRSYDPDAVGVLFSEDASYAYKPWEAPVQGRAAIVAEWLDDRDAPGSWEARYEPLLIEDGRAIAVGETRYADGRVFANLFVLHFDDAGACASFTEWYMLQPA